MSPDRKEEFRWQFAGWALEYALSERHLKTGRERIAMAVDIANTLVAKLEESAPKQEPVREDAYPCTKCGKLRTKAEGGTVFSYCEECWDKDKRERCDHEPVIWRIDTAGYAFKCVKCDKHLYTQRSS